MEEEQGGVELRAGWQLEDDRHPVLKPTPRPFRPKPTPDMQQVRVEVYGEVRGKFDYLFDLPDSGWIPEIDDDRSIQAPADFAEQLASLDLVPREDQPWFLVRGLSPAGHEEGDRYLKALTEMSPDAGSYFLMSLRRKDLTPEEENPSRRRKWKK